MNERNRLPLFVQTNSIPLSSPIYVQTMLTSKEWTSKSELHQFQAGCASQAGKSMKIHPSSDRSSQPLFQRCWNSSRCTHQPQNLSSPEPRSCYEDGSSPAEDAHSQECSPSIQSIHTKYIIYSYTQSLYQRLRLSLQTSTETTTSTGLLFSHFIFIYINQLHQILQRHIQQLIQVHSSISELLESSLLLLFNIHIITSTLHNSYFSHSFLFNLSQNPLFLSFYYFSFHISLHYHLTSSIPAQTFWQMAILR